MMNEDTQSQEPAAAEDLQLEPQVLVAPMPRERTPQEDQMHVNLSLRAQIEAALFASPKPMRPHECIDLVTHDITVSDAESLLEDLRLEYEQRRGGFVLAYMKGHGYQFQSVAEAAPLMERMFATRPRPLSRAALETLAIVAYRQPCTRATVDFIRGVDSGSILKTLMDRSLIKCVGRKEDVPGRPMIFGTTEEFLQLFRISKITELPPLHSFQAASEAVSNALKELETIDEIDPEQFIRDPDLAAPEAPRSLLDMDPAELQGIEQKDLAADAQICEESSLEKIDISSPIVKEDQEPKLDDYTNADSQMDVAAGDRLSPRGRALDS